MNSENNRAPFEHWNGRHSSLVEGEPAAGQTTLASGDARIVTVEGQPSGETVWKVPLAIVLAALGCYVFYVCYSAYSENSDIVGLWGFLGVISWSISLRLPYNRHRYLDYRRRELVVETHYASLQVSTTRHSFSEFGAIVVRHLVHEGEGEDTYTGSVGLKPLKGGKVLWLKQLPATSDDLPPEALTYTAELHRLTGIPMPGGPAYAT